MPYFPVDDQMPFHPKVIAAGNAAMGLWVRAGAWSRQHGTGGYVRAEMAAALGTGAQAAKLVHVGLWERVDGGFRFHDWTDYGSNAEADVLAQRRARDRARKRAARIKTPDVRGRSEDVSAENVPPVLDSSPIPTYQDNPVRPVGDRESYPQDDGRRVEAARTASLTGLGITDFVKVKTEICRRTGRDISDATAFRLVLDVLSKATGVKNPQAYVLGSIRNSWAELQKTIDVEGLE